MDSKGWEPATSKEKSQDQPSLPKSHTVAVYKSTNKALKKVDFKRRCSGDVSGSGLGSYSRSYTTCQKCGKKGHTKKDCRSKGNGFSGKPDKKYSNELPK